MKRIATITCLIVLAAGPASVWADAFDHVPPQHRNVTMQSSDRCLSPVCCMAPAPVPARRVDHERLAAATAAPTRARIALVAAAIPTLVDPLAGESSPAHSQTSPVLLR